MTEPVAEHGWARVSRGPGGYLAECTCTFDACEDDQDKALAKVQAQLIEALADVKSLRILVRP